MPIVQFSIPSWKSFEVSVNQDVCDYLKQAQRHANHESSPVHYVANLLMSVALTFFSAIPLAIKAVGEAGLCYLAGDVRAAKKAFYAHGAHSLTTLGFSIYQVLLMTGVFFGAKKTIENLDLRSTTPLITNASLIQDLLKENDKLKVSGRDKDLLRSQDQEYHEVVLKERQKGWDAEKKKLKEKVQQLEQENDVRIKKVELANCDKIADLEKQVGLLQKRWGFLKKTYAKPGKTYTGEVVTAGMQRLEQHPEIFLRNL